MLINRKMLLIAIGVLIILGIGVLIYSGNLNIMHLSQKSYKTPNGIVTIPIILPDTPTNLTKYHIIPQLNDSAHYSVNNLAQTRVNVTSESDAPLIVPTVLEKYGGLPSDAICAGAETTYLETHKTNIIPFFPPEVIARYPVSTDVDYGRKLNNIPVTGDGGFIKISLGENGELLYLNKVWHSVQPAGTEKIIPVSQAIEKLGRGEVLNPLKCICDINVDHIYIAYWEKGAGVQQEYLDPVWVFSGTTSSGDVIKYKVYAREDDDFPKSLVPELAGAPAGTTSPSYPISGQSLETEATNTMVKSGNLS